MADADVNYDEPFQTVTVADPRNVMPIDQSNPAGHIEKLLGKTYGNGQCVGIVQDPALGGAVGRTSGWRPGGAVGPDTQMGAPLAIFHNGEYTNTSGQSHAVRMMRRFDDGSILAMEQYVDKNGNQVPAKLTLIPNTGKGGEYDASSYSVINDKGGSSNNADDALVKRYNQIHAPAPTIAATATPEQTTSDQDLANRYATLHGGQPGASPSEIGDPEGGPSVVTVPTKPGLGQFLLGQAKLGTSQFVSNLPMASQASQDKLRAAFPPNVAAQMEKANAGAFQGQVPYTNQDVYGSENVVAPPYSRYPGAVIHGVTSNPALSAMAPVASVGSALGGEAGADIAPHVGISENTGRAVGSTIAGLAGLKYTGSARMPDSGVQYVNPPTSAPVIPAPGVTKAALDATLTKANIPESDAQSIVTEGHKLLRTLPNDRAVTKPIQDAMNSLIDPATNLVNRRSTQIVGARNVINDQITKLENSTSSNAQAAIDGLKGMRSTLEGIMERHNPGSAAAFSAHDAALANAAIPPTPPTPLKEGLGSKAWSLARIATPILADYAFAGNSGLGGIYSAVRMIQRASSR